ncbi:MAG: class I SAM-dependent methyltransferase [Oscillospiraceae bacterium]|nr:class I SAM-dependent methyltransferase [Oscillospiraceae bacterium]
MRYSDAWQDYELIDTSDNERLERWGNVILIRPDPQIIWTTDRRNPLWRKADARYSRSSSGGGSWQVNTKIPDSWRIKYQDLTFAVKPMGFKHTGVFPEQAVNWEHMTRLIQSEKKRNPQKEIRVLNLFAYTGAATCACLLAGANVCHVDASKGMTAWAKENAALSSAPKERQRWIVEDCIKFIRREQRRGSTYDAVIMDPPSYGRGPNGEVWKLEEQVFSLVEECVKVLSPNPLFFVINSYTTGLSPSVMNYIAGLLIKPKFGGFLYADEIGIPVSETGLILPCGASAIWQSSDEIKP